MGMGARPVNSVGGSWSKTRRFGTPFLWRVSEWMQWVGGWAPSLVIRERLSNSVLLPFLVL